MSSPGSLASFIIQSYVEIKRLHPTEGRRKWKLRVAQQFWTAVGSSGTPPLALRQPGQDSLLDPASAAESDNDPDPLDEISCDVPGLGLIVRTDFSDEPSWMAFCARLREGEKELMQGSNADEDGSKQPDGEDSNSDSDGDDPQWPTIFYTINPSSAQERELLTNVSNLTVLRMFNEVNVRPSPPLPQGTKRIDPPNRLVDYHGWQEIYEGKNVWVYDTKSNTDQCARVVSQSGDMYGTAAGDSWRGRVSHISELQVNLFSGAIKVDFGGLDRWDYDERRRNMMEAEGN